MWNGNYNYLDIQIKIEEYCFEESDDMYIVCKSKHYKVVISGDGQTAEIQYK
ncbi:MAG: hypothetical protein ACI35S_03630 [Anaeroplasma sp.]